MSNCSYTILDLDESIYEKVAPWIGMYIGGASLVCVLLMVADLFNSFVQRKWWIPSKFFSFNAATLTLLAVATKMSSDIEAHTPSVFYGKLLGLFFLSITMTHAMPSLYVMNGVTLFSNVTALGILVITLFVDVIIQINNGIRITLSNERNKSLEDNLKYVFWVVAQTMLYNFLNLLCYSLMVPTMRKHLERQYNSIRDEMLHEMSRTDATTKLSVEKLREYLCKYWLMAFTSSPDYVLRKSKLSCFCALQNSLVFLIFFYVTLGMFYVEFQLFNGGWKCDVKSDYRWSTLVIFVVQSLGIIIGVLVSLLRGLDSIPSVFNILKSLFTINKTDYQLLREWMEIPLPLQIRSKVLRKLTSITRTMSVAAVMALQFVLMSSCKIDLLLVCLLLLVVTVPIKLLLVISRKCRGMCVKKKVDKKDEELLKYVLHLKQKKQSSLKKIVRQWKKHSDDWIRSGEANQPLLLNYFLRNRSSIQEGFKGLHDVYDSDILSKFRTSKHKPSRSWGLVLVTLASIVRATFPLATKKSLMDCVDEGLKYILYIDETLCEKESTNTHRAAKMVWEGVYLHGRWLDVNLAKISSQTSPVDIGGIILKLNMRGMERIKKFENVCTANQSTKVMAAYYLYGITETMLHKHNNGVPFRGWSVEWLESLVVDLMGACLTNLPLAIFSHCSSGKFGLREDKVREAAFILGETKAILTFLETNGPSHEYPKNKEYFESWC